MLLTTAPRVKQDRHQKYSIILYCVSDNVDDILQERMSPLSTADPGSPSSDLAGLVTMTWSPSSDLVTPDYDDWPDLPACSLCLSLNTSDYCHHTGQIIVSLLVS